jgi:cold-inducible RNA-binding protein
VLSAPIVLGSRLIVASHPFRGRYRPVRCTVSKKLYVGNLSFDVTESRLQEMFAPFGTVQSAQLIMDRDTGRSKGFAFVEMGTDQEATAAIAGMNGQMIEGRALTVNEAKPKTDRPRSGGGGGFSSRRY